MKNQYLLIFESHESPTQIKLALEYALGEIASRSSGMTIIRLTDEQVQKALEDQILPAPPKNHEPKTSS